MSTLTLDTIRDVIEKKRTENAGISGTMMAINNLMESKLPGDLPEELAKIRIWVLKWDVDNITAHHALCRIRDILREAA